MRADTAGYDPLLALVQRLKRGQPEDIEISKVRVQARQG